MSTPSSALDRLEARLEAQASRIDELSRALELQGIVPEPARSEREADNGFFDELLQIEEAPFARERRRPSRRRSDRRRPRSATRV